MENQTNTTSTKQIMLNYGLLFGFASIFINVVNYALGDIYKPHWSVQAVSFLVAVAFIVMGLKKVKENNNGYLTLGQSFKAGIGIMLVGAIIGLIYTYIFMTFIEPNYMSNMLELSQQKMLETRPNMTDEQVEAAMNMSKKFSGFGVIAVAGLLWSIFLGFVISLVAGLIMKKSPEQDY